MKIANWKFKNFKSYGSIEQSIEFLEDKGELILLGFGNGAGKTSLLNALDFALYGENLNAKGKRLSQKLIPNRTNNDACWTQVNFTDDQKRKIQITRTLSGSLKTQLTEDGEPYTKAGKPNDRIEQIIGFDFETYKSFISLNVTIFKDFINLTPEDKRTILDKLFNLEMINELNKILKALQKQNTLDYNSVNHEINLYEDSISELKESIEEVMNQKIVNNDEKIKKLKDLLNAQKNKFIELEEAKTLIEEELDSIKEQINNLSLKKNDINRDIRDIQKQIDLYNQGKCPTCGADFATQIKIKEDLQERLKLTNKILEQTNILLNETNINHNDIKAKYNKANNDYNELTIYLSGIKKEIKSLKEEQENNKEGSNEDIEIFKKNITKNEDKLNICKSKFLESQKLKLIYDTMLPIWSESGVKRDIIEEIIGPINSYLNEDLQILGSKYNVEIDNNFDAHIFEWNTEIEPETLSTGEAKRINLVIMLAYIKMIRLKKDINILILDELFASIDIQGVDFILTLMKKYANERGINIIIVHHSELNKSLFDRIITVKKTHYSYIEDERF